MTLRVRSSDRRGCLMPAAGGRANRHRPSEGLWSNRSRTCLETPQPSTTDFDIGSGTAQNYVLDVMRHFSVSCVIDEVLTFASAFPAWCHF